MKILTILHLCLAFTAISWYGGYPFMSQHLTNKTKQLQCEAAMRNRELFEKLPLETRASIKNIYEASKTRQPYLQSMHLLIREIPLMEKMWLLFSVILCVLLLKQREGIEQAIFIIPLLTACYALENHWYGLEPKSLFPSEQYIVRTYLKEPLTGTIAHQKDQLTLAWNRYLEQEWGSEHAFLVAQVLEPDRRPFRNKKPTLVLLAYMLWNLAFACIAQRRLSYVSA